METLDFRSGMTGRGFSREPCKGIYLVDGCRELLFRAFPLSLSICSTFYEDWSFVMDEERSSMLPTMAAGKPGSGQD